MRLLASLSLLVALAGAGCGGDASSSESVVRAWSSAVNAGDNDSAARLFAPGARVVQFGRVTFLHTHADAVAWNAALPCSAQILSLSEAGETVTATFRLAHRQTSRCDGPGARARAVFRVREGKIVLWHQLATEPSAPPDPAAEEASATRRRLDQA